MDVVNSMKFIKKYHMALVNCKECKKEISDKAQTCPNCGFSFQEFENINNITSIRSLRL